MPKLHFYSMFLAFVAAASFVSAQVPQPAAEPGSVPEHQSTPMRAGANGMTRPAGPVRISGGVIAGLRLTGEQPVYPPDAKVARIGGAVVLHAIIGREGTVEKLEVISGPEMLANAALEAVKTWVYRPYLLNGEPVEVDTTITVNFHPSEAISPSSTPGEQSSRSQALTALPPGRVRVSSGVMSGQRISGPQPVIPAGVATSGGVILHAIVARDGSIEGLAPVHGSPELTRAVMDAVKQWQYKPYLLNGQPVEVDTTISLNW